MASFDDPQTQTAIKDLQVQFDREYRSNPDQCSFKDYQRVISDPHYVYRFYRARHCNFSAALKMMMDTMKWRKCTIKLDQYEDYSFPIEFYKVSAVFPYQEDKSGYPTIFIRVSQHRKVPELEEYTKAFFVHVFDKVDRFYGEKGYALIFDLTSASYRNLDWDYLKFMINFGANYCPAGAKYILVLNVPWALNTFRKMVFSFLNDDYFKLIKFVNGDQIYDYIEPENVPHYLGGKCKRNYCSVPADSVPIEQLVERYGYTSEDYKRIIPVYQDALDQADEFLSSVDWYEPKDYFDRPGTVEKVKSIDLYQAPSLDHNENVTMFDQATVFSVKPEDQIVFTYDLVAGHYKGTLVIENKQKDSVLFKVQSNHPNNYQVSPRYGILGFRSKVKVLIEMTNQDWAYWSKMDRMNQMSKFRLLFKPLVGSASELPLISPNLLTVNQFDQLWTEKSTEIYSMIRTTRIVKEFPVKMGRRDKFRQPSANLFKHKLPQWSDNLSIEEKLRCLNGTVNSLESNQRKLTFLVRVLGLAYLILFGYFLIATPSIISMVADTRANANEVSHD